MTFHADIGKSWRGLLVQDMSDRDRTRCEQDPGLRVLDDGELGDGRLVFEDSAHKIFADNPSKYGVNRNVRFVHKLDHTVDAHLVGGARVLEESATP